MTIVSIHFTLTLPSHVEAALDVTVERAATADAVAAWLRDAVRRELDLPVNATGLEV